MNSRFLCPSCSIETEHSVIGNHYSDALSQEFSIYSCNHCKTLMTHPFLTTQQIDEYYQDEEINGKDKYVRWNRKYRYIHDWIKKSINLDKLKVLEIGSNSGNLLRYFKENSACDVIGLELSDQCKEYSENVNDVKVYSDWLANFIKEEDFRANLVLMIHTFEHITDPVSILNEIDTVLTEDGYLYIEIPNARMIELDIVPEENPLCIPFHAYLYNMNSLCAVLTKNGYDIVKKRYYSRKEDGGAMSSALARYVKNKVTGLLGNNILSTVISALFKALIRFYPNRLLVGYIFSKLNKATTIAVLCKKS